MATKKRGPGKPRTNPTREEVDKRLDNIKTITIIPPGFIGAREFAQKCGISPGGLTHAKNAGKFSSVNMRWVKFPGKREQLFFNWEACGPSFIRQRPRENWPEWFQESEAKALAALESDSHAGRGGEPMGTGSTTQMAPVAVVDLNSAKLKEAQLNIQKKELELQKAKNEVLDIEEVEDVIDEVTNALRQAMLAVSPRVSPLVAAENSPHKCLKILDDEIHRACECLGSLQRYLEEKKLTGFAAVKNGN